MRSPWKEAEMCKSLSLVPCQGQMAPIAPTKSVHKVTRLRSVANNTTGGWNDRINSKGPSCVYQSNTSVSTSSQLGYHIQAHSHCSGIFQLMVETLPSPGNVLESWFKSSTQSCMVGKHMSLKKQLLQHPLFFSLLDHAHQESPGHVSLTRGPLSSPALQSFPACIWGSCWDHIAQSYSSPVMKAWVFHLIVTFRWLRQETPLILLKIPA